jgi:hypothetical protein
MNDKFDQLAKGLAQSVSRRQALTRFGTAIAGACLAWLGLANNAHADGNGNGACLPSGAACRASHPNNKCCSGVCVPDPDIMKHDIGFCV